MYVNPASAELYSLSSKEVIGKTYTELGIDPEKVKFWNDYHEMVFILGMSVTVEAHVVSPQGKRYDFNTKIVPEFTDGKVNAVLAITRDISDIREAEFKLKQTLDNLENLVEEHCRALKSVQFVKGK